MFVSIDTETTAASPETAEVVEIFAVKFDGKGLHEEFYSLCRPVSGVIPSDATAIHGITSEQVAGSPLFGDIRNDLIAFIGDAVVVGHNVEAYDLPVIGITVKKIFDTLKVCRRLFDGSHKLKACCEHFSIEWNDTDAHGAKYDALKVVEIFLQLLKPENQAELKRRNEQRAIEEARLQSHPIVSLVIEGGTFIVSTEKPVELAEGAPAPVMVKKATYGIKVAPSYCPGWAAATSIPGVVRNIKRGGYYIAAELADAGLRGFSTFVDPESGIEYDKKVIQKYMPNGSGLKSDSAICIGLETIKSLEPCFTLTPTWKKGEVIKDGLPF